MIISVDLSEIIDGGDRCSLATVLIALVYLHLLDSIPACLAKFEFVVEELWVVAQLIIISVRDKGEDLLQNDWYLCVTSLHLGVNFLVEALLGCR